MQQRVVLAIMRKPKVLLLDEPFGALDPVIVSGDSHLLMKRFWNETDLTVLMVTQDPEIYPLRFAAARAARHIAPTGTARSQGEHESGRPGALTAKELL